MAKRFAPVHPGDVLSEEDLLPKEISHSRFAKKLGVNPRLVSQIIHSLNQKARYDLAGREGKARRTS